MRFEPHLIAVREDVECGNAGFAVNIIFAVVVAYLGVVVGRWLFGRENL